eukprot:5515308-Prymnesium_polylepis.1
MERVGACVRMGEPVLLVGETGTGDGAADACAQPVGAKRRGRAAGRLPTRAGKPQYGHTTLPNMAT